VCPVSWHTAKLAVTQPAALSHFCVPSAVPSARRHVLPCARHKAHGKEAVRRLALCRAHFAVCSSRRKFCRVPQAHGKARESGSDSPNVLMDYFLIRLITNGYDCVGWLINFEVI